MVGGPTRQPWRSGRRSETQWWNWPILNKGWLCAGAGLRAGQEELNSHEGYYAWEVCESDLAPSSYPPAKEKPGNIEKWLLRPTILQFNWRLSKEIIQLNCGGACTIIKIENRESTPKTHWGWHLPSDESIGGVHSSGYGDAHLPSHGIIEQIPCLLVLF